MDWLLENLEWMYWTPASAIAFGGLLLTLAAMTAWDIYSPSLARKGFLPMPTTRGDRLFISILTLIAIHLLWLGIMGAANLLLPLLIALAAIALIARWG